MPRPRNAAPSYLLHRQSGRGRLVWSDSLGIRQERLLPGAYNSPESLTAKARLELELATSPTRSLVGGAGISVAEVLAAFLDHAEKYYLDEEGEQTKEVTVLKYAIRPVRELYGHTPAAEFGPRSLAAVREKMIAGGLCRSIINIRVNKIRMVFKWAASEELVPASVYESLRTLAGLRKGRTSAKESRPVLPVDDAVVDATLPFMPDPIKAMIRMMRYTGARPAEICSMSWGQIDRGGEVWVYSPDRHKTRHHGKRRVIPLGPNAREVLTAFVGLKVLGPDEFIFSPHRAREERFAAMRANRKSKVQPSQACRRRLNAKRAPTASYKTTAVSHAVSLACDRAFPHPTLGKRRGESRAAWKARLTDEQKAELREWQRAYRWTPYQLRHGYATRVRRDFGLEAAQVLLGHSRADVTQVYAERDERLATAIAAKIG